MNQKEESNNDNMSEIKGDTFKLPETNENLAADEDPISAPAQIVKDISATPAEIIESAFPEENNEEIPETSQTSEETTENPEQSYQETTENPEQSHEETAQATVAPIVSSSEPSETGIYQLVNSMVNKLYREEINLKELKIENAELNSSFIDQFEKLGLEARREGNIIRIEGTPTTNAQGEHTLFLDYAYNGEQRVHRKKFTLLINPDPKSLWKNLEPGEDLPYRKDHEAAKQIVSQDFKVVAASRRGRSHAHEGKFREDDFAVHCSKNGWHILIVADGAGSAQLSREGSRLACQIAKEFVEKSIAELLEPKFDLLISEFASAKPETSEKEIKNLLYQVLCGAAFAAYKRLEQESAATGIALKEYSTTLLISIVKKCAQGFFIAGFGVGDGAIGVYTESPNAVELMNTPDGGEFSGQTRFLTMREVIGDGNEMLRRVKFKLFDKFTILALMTDGISDPKFGTDNNLIAFEKWDELVRELLAEIDFNRRNDTTAKQLLDYMDFWSPGEHDDRTLAILY